MTDSKKTVHPNMTDSELLETRKQLHNKLAANGSCERDYDMIDCMSDDNDVDFDSAVGDLMEDIFTSMCNSASIKDPEGFHFNTNTSISPRELEQFKILVEKLPWLKIKAPKDGSSDTISLWVNPELGDISNVWNLKRAPIFWFNKETHFSNYENWKTLMRESHIGDTFINPNPKTCPHYDLFPFNTVESYSIPLIGKLVGCGNESIRFYANYHLAALRIDENGSPRGDFLYKNNPFRNEIVFTNPDTKLPELLGDVPLDALMYCDEDEWYDYIAQVLD